MSEEAKKILKTAGELIDQLQTSLENAKYANQGLRDEVDRQVSKVSDAQPQSGCEDVAITALKATYARGHYCDLGEQCPGCMAGYALEKITGREWTQAECESVTGASCLVCGHVKPFAVWYGENPSVGVCVECKDAADEWNALQAQVNAACKPPETPDEVERANDAKEAVERMLREKGDDALRSENAQLKAENERLKWKGPDISSDGIFN